MSPVFSNQQNPRSVTYLYGGEYETYDSHMDKDPTCSVCRSTFSTTVMIPGTSVCTPGWHLQYSGFLMAGYYDHPAGSEYICVDSQFQSRLSSDTDQNGKLLYYTVITLLHGVAACLVSPMSTTKLYCARSAQNNVNG